MSLNFLFLDLNSFFASVEQAENPKLQNKPVAVVPMLADTTSCIAASYEAKAFGIKTGTSVKDAKRLCPEIIFVEGDHRKYVRYHHNIIATVDRFLPVSKVLSIDEMACQLIGRERDENFARAKAVEIKNAIYREISPCMSCSIGVAPNRYLAKVASDMQKPNGLTVIRLEDIPKIFYHLTPRDFPGIGPRMEERLITRRCTTVEQMYRFSLNEMRQIWGGINGEQFWYLIRGDNLEEKITKRRTIGHSKVLSPVHRNLRDAKAVATRLLSKACMRLREEKFFAKEMHISIKYMSYNENDKYWESRLRFEETQDSFFLTSKLDEIWEIVPNRRFLKVGITLCNFVPENKHQLSFFEDQSTAPLMEALDNLNKKYSRNLVYLGSSHHAKDSSTARIAFQRIPKEYE